MRWARADAAPCAVALGLAALAGSLFYGDPAAAPHHERAVPNDARPSARVVVTVPGRQATSDSSLAVRFLAGARGSSPLACELMMRSLGVGFGWGGFTEEPGPDAAVRELIRWAVDRRENPAAVPPLRSALRDSDPCVSRVAARLLGETRHPDAMEALTEALGDRDARIRRLGAIGLGHSDGRTPAATVLIRALGDGDGRVRAAAAWALGSIEEERGIPELIGLLRDDPEARVRRAAASALGDILD